MDENSLITEERGRNISQSPSAIKKATPNNLSKTDLERLESMMRMCVMTTTQIQNTSLRKGI